MRNPVEINVQLESYKIFVKHNFNFIYLIILKFCTQHDNGTADPVKNLGTIGQWIKKFEYFRFRNLSFTISEGSLQYSDTCTILMIPRTTVI